MGLIAGSGSDGVDSNRCVRMAIVHDVAESIVGDITPHCNVSSGDLQPTRSTLGYSPVCLKWPFGRAQVSKEEKHKLENDAIAKIQEMLGGNTRCGLMFYVLTEISTTHCMGEPKS